MRTAKDVVNYYLTTFVQYDVPPLVVWTFQQFMSRDDSGPIQFRVQNVTYDNTFWVKRNWSDNEVNEASEIFVVPNVGIILMWIAYSAPTMDPPEISRTWELIDYDFSP